MLIRKLPSYQGVLSGRQDRWEHLWWRDFIALRPGSRLQGAGQVGGSTGACGHFDLVQLTVAAFHLRPLGTYSYVVGGTYWGLPFSAVRRLGAYFFQYACFLNPVDYIIIFRNLVHEVLCGGFKVHIYWNYWWLSVAYWKFQMNLLMQRTVILHCLCLWFLLRFMCFITFFNFFMYVSVCVCFVHDFSNNNDKNN